jgi:hypothetical protein
VSWQSAYWGLVPLALTTMTQPSGQVLGFPSKYQVYLSSSPVICAADGIFILLKMCAYVLVAGDNPRTAASRILRDRFKDTASDEATSPVIEQCFTGLARNTPFRWFLFVFGALPQAIKLAALRGVPMTQAIGFCYLASFAVIELTVCIANFCKGDTPPVSPASEFVDTVFRNLRPFVSAGVIGYHFLLAPAVCLLCFFIVYAADLLFNPMGELVSALCRSKWHEAGIVFLFSLCEVIVSFISYLLLSRVFTLLKRKGISSSSPFPDEFPLLFWLIACTIPFFFVCNYGIYLTSDGFNSSRCAIILATLIPFLFISSLPILLPIATSYLYFAIFPSQDNMPLDDCLIRPRFLMMSILLMDFFIPFLWYAMIYDPSGTFKPDWTNNLG